MAVDPKTGGLGIPPKALNELTDAFTVIAKIFRKIAAEQPSPEEAPVGAGLKKHP